MIRLGLCCLFAEEPIKFRTTTVKFTSQLTTEQREHKLADLCRTNAESLRLAIEYCHANKIGCFRVNSQILPLKTHVGCGYELESLPDGDQIIEAFRLCGSLAKKYDIRLGFHPDQFVVLNSPREDVVVNSIAELEYQCEVAEWIGADCVNIHGGGGYGDKPAALGRFARNLERLSDRVRIYLTVENDDRTYSPEELLPVCRNEGVPLVYDVHHHRCNKDTLNIDEATAEALQTWNREPLFHISSPREGWSGPKPQRHHDYINIRDFPQEWNKLNITVEVEAKAKELAVKKLRRALDRRHQSK
ncbi:UV DNA damage repair endonuclease UvsE [Planctomicrobium sp.]|jgi:UV DNA damage endonuclease|nr:UV DNA damage repair endonuclease UvsE [Planctomicrobium sp.]MDB4733672.1 UV DNA damage repair endonuclease UvsE [Planctomicrobium sp.]